MIGPCGLCGKHREHTAIIDGVPYCHDNRYPSCYEVKDWNLWRGGPQAGTEQLLDELRGRAAMSNLEVAYEPKLPYVVQVGEAASPWGSTPHATEWCFHSAFALLDAAAQEADRVAKTYEFVRVVRRP